MWLSFLSSRNARRHTRLHQEVEPKVSCGLPEHPPKAYIYSSADVYYNPNFCSYATIILCPKIS